MQMEVWICDSSSSSHCSNSFLVLTNNLRENGRRLGVESRQSIHIVGTGNGRIAFAFPGEVRPLCIVQLIDVLHISDHKTNLLSSLAMESRGYGF